MKTGECDCCTVDENVKYESEIICYCNQIMRQEIESTIKGTGLRSISEIKRHLRGQVISNCAELNPMGKCCHAQFQAVIDEAVKNP